jgi:hypothetical protein
MRFRNSSNYFGLMTNARLTDGSETRDWQGF